jgi:uncharacterized membrane protein YeiH
MKSRSEVLLLTLDLAGVFVFALEGASAAISAQLDLLGIMVIAFATALCGGIIRDLLIGAVPPKAIQDWPYGSTAFAGGAIVFLLHGFVDRIPGPLMLLLDAGGLALCAVAGADKALEYRINPFLAVLMGGVTGVGGGTVRDVLLAHVPRVLESDVYASAALAGSALMVIGIKLKGSPMFMAIAGGTVCFLLRIVSVWQDWNLPKVLW